MGWQRVPASQIQFKALDHEIRWLFAFSLLYVAGSFLIGELILIDPHPILHTTQFNQDVWYALVYKIILLLVVPSYVYFVRWGYTADDLLLGLMPTRRNLMGAALLISVGFLVNASYLKDIPDALTRVDHPLIRLVLAIHLPLFTAAIPEEFFFRGYLQTRLEKKWNRGVAVLVSSALFMAWHLPSRYLLATGSEGQAGDWGLVLLHTGLPVFIIGVAFGYHWSRYRNIVLLAATHWAIDLLPSIGSFLLMQT